MPRHESHLQRAAACVGKIFSAVDVSYVEESIPDVPADVVRDVAVTFLDIGKGFRRCISTSGKLLFLVVDQCTIFIFYVISL